MKREELLLRQAIELYGEEKFDRAERCLREAISLSDEPELSNDLGIVLKAQGRFADAIEAYQHAVELNPAFADARYNLGNAYRAANKLREAVECFEAVLKTQPGHAHATAALGQSLLALRSVEQAAITLERAVELNAPDASLYFDLGNAQISRKEWVLASVAFRKVLELAPDWHEAHHNHGQALFELGDTDAALEQFRKAAEGPQAELPRAMIAVVIPGAPSAGNRSILEARRSFAELLPGPANFPHRSASRARLKIGYVSSFFHRDNWMKPVWNLVNRHDRESFELHLFSSVPASEIRHGYFSRSQDHWHDIGQLTNKDAAELIASCKLDLLIDLNGYSDLRRLPLFALRPAPRIAGWFNLYATTGIAAYDFLIGDSEVAPLEEEQFYTEKIVRVPGSYLSFDVNYPVPDIQRPPCLMNKRITFGCLAPQYKITPAVAAVWSRILSQVPGSELLLKSRALQSTANRQFIVDAFAQQGIHASRLHLELPAAHFEFLRAYERVDIALDTFPYNGGTTTTEAIWQGVPVVTFSGDRWISRTSASILRAGNLGGWVEADMNGYVDLAVRAATRPDAAETLDDLRQNMRDRLRASPVCDSESFARNMERIYIRLCEEAR